MKRHPQNKSTGDGSSTARGVEMRPMPKGNTDLDTDTRICGNFLGEIYTFVEYPITGEGSRGDCGFTALGPGRDVAINSLRHVKKIVSVMDKLSQHLSPMFNKDLNLIFCATQG